MGIPVVISAAGRGTRMQQLTQDKPKHLIEVAGRPFLAYLMDALWQAGCHELYLVVGYQAPLAYSFVQHYQADRGVTVINQFERLGEDRYGTLMPLVAAQPELKGREVMVVMGDNLYSAADLKAMAAVPGSAVAGFVHPQPERYGVLLQQGGRLQKIVEKSDQPQSSLINTGLYRFSPAIWQVLPEVGVSPRGEYELTEAVNVLAVREPVAVVPLKDYWLDFGRPEDVATIAAFMTAGRLA